MALLDYTVSKGPELSNPLDTNSEPTGRTIFVLDEYYEAPGGVARHWQDTSVIYMSRHRSSPLRWNRGRPARA